MTIQQLVEKAATQEYPHEYLRNLEKGRQAFLQKFPREKLADLTLEEYAIGNGVDSFCYWLEFKKIEKQPIAMGIGGGNSSKFGIYRAGDGCYYSGYHHNSSKLESGNELDAAFQKLKTDILMVLELAGKDEIRKIKEVETRVSGMVLQKILFLYFPEKFLNIGRADILKILAKDLNLNPQEHLIEKLIETNYECRKALAEIPQFSSWHSAAIGKIVWENYVNETKPIKKVKASNTRYWHYSPGNNGANWDEFFQEGIVAINWDEIGDLRQFKSIDQIKEALITHYGGKSNRTMDAKANYEFLYELKPGDVVIAKKGRTKLLGYGVVTSDYEFRDKRKEAKSVRRIDWKLRGEWSTEFDMAPKTLTEITDYLSDSPDYQFYFERLLGIMGESKKETGSKEQAEALNHSLNTIFYGPPGTGKTHLTIRRAAEIIAGKTIRSQEEASKIYAAALHDQIEFITFHQNYSYEDFIQGLRPETDNQNSLSFRKRDGIFKRMADKALHNLEQAHRDVAGLEKEAAFEHALAEFKEMVLDNDGRFVLTPSVSLVAVEEDAFRYNGDNWANGGNGLKMKYDDLREFFRQDVTQRKDIRDLRHISGIAKQHATYFFHVYEQVKALVKSGTTHIEKVERKNYVLIIDEINRANISRVFGELITLIEPDKRMGGSMEMKLRLPSGDLFCVPDNLYLIGTMNTADKSISLLDIALRRRFDFEPMYPQYEIDEKGIPNADVLKKINEQIIQLKGHDFQIGHAYFMGDDALEAKLNKKVIPLLLEYFMNDEKQVMEILEKAGMKLEATWPLKVAST